jgi:glycosyltransferase involved in cell wall biosynthesis
VGIAFRSEEDLARQLERVAGMSDAERAELGRRAAGRVCERYSWDAVAADYERLFESLAGGRGSARHGSP